MNTEQAMAASHERLTEIVKSKRIPRKLKKKNKAKGKKWSKVCLDYAIKHFDTRKQVKFDFSEFN